MYDVTIIGCGIIGAAAAYELSQYNLRVAVLEKENDIATGTTKANSAIIHAGFDPKPGTLMARLNVEGNAFAREIFAQLDIPHKKCGALVLAFSQEEMATLDMLLQNGTANGVPGLRILNREQTLQLEPNLSDNVYGALETPTAMIVNPWEYALALAETAVKNGVELYRECEVTGIEAVDDGYNVRINSLAGTACDHSQSSQQLQTRCIINAAGLHADTISSMISHEKIETRPDRGEYFLLDKSEGSRVSRVVFQCPTAAGKGILVAPTVHGNLIVGPSSVGVTSRDDVSTSTHVLESVKISAQKSVPGIDFRASIRNFAGIRAKTASKDFIIEETQPGFINLAGIASPGLSSAPAIAKMAVQMLPVSLTPRIGDYTRKRTRFHELSPAQKADLISQNPTYGNVICRCETITEGEILDALNSPIPPRSVDGVKRRTGTGMGRCQGGFCSPRIVEILAKWYSCSPLEILQDGAGMQILAIDMGEAEPHMH